MVQKTAYILVATIIVALSMAQLISLGKIFVGKNNTQVLGSQEIQLTEVPNGIYSTCDNNGKVSEITDLIPQKITIDSVGIDLNVLSVPLKNGTWQVNSGVANFAEGTSLINQRSGNVGIYAHDRKNGFTQIKNLKVGDNVIIYAEKKSEDNLEEVDKQKDLLKVTYNVEYSAISAPQEVEVFYPTEDPTLTLLTCDGDLSKMRYIVRAKLVSIEEQNCDENAI